MTAARGSAAGAAVLGAMVSRPRQPGRTGDGARRAVGPRDPGRTHAGAPRPDVAGVATPDRGSARWPSAPAQPCWRRAKRGKAPAPAYSAASSSSSSMRSSWLYLATRSDRAGAPVLIWPQLVATARSAIVVSSVSPGAVAHHAAVPVALGHLDGIQRLGERADLVDLDEQGVGRARLDAAGEPLGVGDEEVVADELHVVAHPVGHRLPAVPVALVERVLDGDQRVGGDEVGVVVDHLGRRSWCHPRRRSRSSSWNSDAATSSARAICSPGV